MAKDQLQKRPTDNLVGTFHDSGAVNDRLQWAAENMNLITPATSVGRLPEGCGIALTALYINQKDDCYPVGGGKHGLFKTALQRVAAALGVSWDMSMSGRVDDGSHPWFCHWRAVGSYRAFDGQAQQIGAEKVLDLRPGSPQLVGKTDKQLAEMRAHIASHAETKAQLRAIRSTGIKTSYTAEELSRPFVIARIMFTGATRDPELKRMFAEKTADAFLGSTRALYGGGAAPTPSAALRLSAPPPVGSFAMDDDDDGYGDDRGGPPPQQQRQEEPAKPAQTAKAAQTGGRDAGAFTLPGKGRDSGKPLADCETSSLEWWANKIGENLDSRESRNPEHDEALLKAIHAEIAKREGTQQPAGDKQGALY